MIKKLTRGDFRAEINKEKRKEVKERIAASAPLCLLYCRPNNPESTNTWNDLIDPLPKA